MYSLELHVSCSTYLAIFKAHEGSREALNVPIIPPRACARGKVIVLSIIGCVVVIIVVVDTKIAKSGDLGI